MQASLQALQPQLVRTVAEVESLMGVIAREKAEVVEPKVRFEPGFLCCLSGQCISLHLPVALPIARQVVVADCCFLRVCLWPARRPSSRRRRQRRRQRPTQPRPSKTSALQTLPKWVTGMHTQHTHARRTPATPAAGEGRAAALVRNKRQSGPRLITSAPLSWQAMPILNAALEALDTIEDKDIQYIRKLPQPPLIIKRVLAVRSQALQLPVW